MGKKETLIKNWAESVTQTQQVEIYSQEAGGCQWMGSC